MNCKLCKESHDLICFHDETNNLSIKQFYEFAKTKEIFDPWLSFLFVHVKSYINIKKRKISDDSSVEKIKCWRAKQYERDFRYIFREINKMLKPVNISIIYDLNDVLNLYYNM